MNIINRINQKYTEETNVLMSFRAKVILFITMSGLAVIGYVRSEMNRVEMFKVKEYEHRICVDHSNSGHYTCYDKVSY